jgi:hypothetical protein
MLTLVLLAAYCGAAIASCIHIFCCSSHALTRFKVFSRENTSYENTSYENTSYENTSYANTSYERARRRQHSPRPLGAPRLVLYRMQVLFLANTASPQWQIPTQYSRLDHDEISVRQL